MKILGIETSCDDTGIAIVEVSVRHGRTRFKILSNIISSQVEIHKKYGGVYPMLAKREHEKNLPIVLDQALRQMNINSIPSHQIDVVACTQGPGLSPCLWTGLNFAKNIAEEWDVPLIPVDHIEAHLLIGLLFQNTQYQIRNTKYFPAVALIVSGGHTQLVLVEKMGSYRIIGETRDDAAGEAFDKTARILGLGFPGGPEIAKIASQYKIQNTKYKIRLPRPMLHTKDYDFSFSGLKTAVLYDYQSRSPRERRSKAYIQAMAAEIQQAITDVLIAKTIRAAEEYRAKTIILGGGVAANVELRQQLSYQIQNTTYKIQFLIPPPHLCTDNGAMIAIAGYFKFLHKKYIGPEAEVEAKPNLRIE
ncbi:MAG: tRNA (adenosine(37)-N6)-threonylcarbamoyltransferase complex transferase subunit TsaD [Candidatus Wildermuthbacteria bacterium]|nr:tRNA (adenosine(37)-N6)-threonylcarbamoyltransferase complex transferase subunit TsaD [Candidatus Wildermuthbacteria bacterium]